MRPGDRNTEALIGTAKGVVRAHTVERLTPSTKGDINYILDMRGTPQRPDPSKPGLHIPVRISLDPEVLVEMPETRPARKEEGPRAAYLTRENSGTLVSRKAARDAAEWRPRWHPGRAAASVERECN